ncbi:hypothetical protein GW17_00042371 [Ensete ventricosum]|nr:hypothetical protein GW17_00042371 [Ensete ventricosum]
MRIQLDTDVAEDKNEGDRISSPPWTANPFFLAPIGYAAPHPWSSGKEHRLPGNLQLPHPVIHDRLTAKLRWLATARPPAGEPVMAWLPTRGGHPRARPAAASPAASRGSDAGRRGGCPLVGRLPVAKGSRRFRRGSDYGGEVRVKEG